MTYFVEERIPITRQQARVADFDKPFPWVGREWWVRESPEFQSWQNTTFVLARRIVESWEVA